MRRLPPLVLILPALLAAADPVFHSEEVTPGHAVKIKADITGADALYLVVTDAGDGFSCDWADWVEPTLHGPDGTTKTLTELEWQSASSGWGAVHVDQSAAGGPLIVAGRRRAGIGTHANSIIAYKLPEGYSTFTAVGGVDAGGARQNNGATSSVRFAVYTEKPDIRAISDPGGLRPAKSLSRFQHPDDLAVTLFAAEPMLVNPTSIDIDAQGRVWVFEVVNYRIGSNDARYRETGDRILILEDTNQDGRADKSTTFYQGTELNGGHGVCVLGNRVIVSSPDEVFVLTDTDGDDRADKKELLFSCANSFKHDHGLHAFHFGPDGKLYFTFGNRTQQINDTQGNVVIDLAGNEVAGDAAPYRQGMVLRCDLDGSNVEVLGWNFRNNWEMAVDSFGNIWQSDNDDDGNRSTRINFVMEYGNYGYVDEITGAGWRSQPRTGDKPLHYWHWHQGDPGVIPNLLNTGGGSPVGIVFYEGKLLPERFHKAIIHVDAGPRVVRAYPAKPDGAGYQARIEMIIDGRDDQWFRPSDVCVAPDGSLFVADWYDAGVGGHGMADVREGRIYRVTPPEAADHYRVPDFDFRTPEGAARALTNPALSVRYLAWTALAEMGQKAVPALKTLWHHNNPDFRARALWVLGQLPSGPKWVEKAIADENPNIRVTGIRLARQLARDGKLQLANVLAAIVHDPSPQVRRVCAIALHEIPADRALPLWLELTAQYDGQDRWSLEALGIAARGRWEQYLPAWLAQVGDDWNSLAGRDILWRSRSSLTPQYLAQIITDPSIPQEQLSRYFHAFHFQPTDAAQAALIDLAFSQSLKSPRSQFIATEALARVKQLDLAKQEHRRQLNRILADLAGTRRYVDVINQFQLTGHTDDLLDLALAHPDDETGLAAIQTLLQRGKSDLLAKTLRQAPPKKATHLAQAIGNAASKHAVNLLMPLVGDEEVDLEVRRQAVGGLAHTRGGAQQLLSLIKRDKLDSSLEPAAQAALESNTDPALQQRIAQAFPAPPGSAHQLPPISQLVKRRGDATKGRIVFLTKGTCVKCHKFQGIGKNVGPDLAQIGDKLSRQALYEAILFPSAGISHNFACYTAVTQEGTVVTGLLISSTGEEVVLQGADGIERTFGRDELLEFIKQDVSLMPADVQKMISEEELVNLVEFLTTLTKEES